jgi:hypothetical protein
VWLHYFALLVLPLALIRSRVVWPWLLLWAFWLTSSQENQGDLWRISLAAALVTAVFVVVSLARAAPAIREEPA